VGSKEGQHSLVGGVHGSAGKCMPFAGINSGLAGEVLQLAKADELTGIDDRDLLILLAMNDEKRR
jgi:hypothetical protein